MTESINERDDIRAKAAEAVGGVKRTHLPIALGDCTSESVATFFEEEFPALVFACVAQCLVGLEVVGVDFKKRRILLEESKLVLTDENDPDPDSFVMEGTIPRECQSCMFITPGVGGKPSKEIALCRLHGYASHPCDTCDQWEVNPNLTEPEHAS